MDSLPGGIGLPQLVQVTKDNVLSVIREHFVAVLNCKGSLYLLCLEIVGLSVFWFAFVICVFVAVCCHKAVFI